MLSAAAFTLWVLAHSQHPALAEPLSSCAAISLPKDANHSIQCINSSRDGADLDTRVAQLFEANCIENSVIAKFRESYKGFSFADLIPNPSSEQETCSLKPPDGCIAMRDTLNKVITRVKKNFEPTEILNPRCVERSMKSISAAYAGTRAKTHLCKSDLDRPNVISGPPCVTREMAAYMAWITSKAATCVPPPDRPIDLFALLKQLTNESHFGFFINGKNGRGFTQMIPQAISEMRRTEGGFRTIRKLQTVLDGGAKKGQGQDAEKDRAQACEIFRDVIAKEMEIQKAPKEDREARAAELTGNEEKCMLNQPGIGTARAALLGVAHFVYYRDHFGRNGSASMTSEAGEIGLKWPRITNLGAEIAFSFAGPAGARATIEKALAYSGCTPSNPAKSCTEERVIEYMKAIHANSPAAKRVGFSYLERNNKAAEFLLPKGYRIDSSPNGQGPGKTETELRDICVF